MHSQEQQFDVFISYARADNADGGINRLVAAIEDEYARFFSGSRLRVFFDTETIASGDDWSNRLYTGLKRSRMMIAMLSSNYLASAWCRKEWQTWCELERSRGWLSNMLCPVYYVAVPDSKRRIDDFIRQRDVFARSLAAYSLTGFTEWEGMLEENECLAELCSRQTIDLKAWYTEGADALRHEEIRQRVANLARTIEHKVTLAKNAEQDEGYFIRANRNFCGRIHELKHIRHCFARSEKGIVPVLHGVGGEGKTALAVAYAHSFAYDYPGGRFLVQCEGLQDLKQCFCKLGEEQGVDIAGTGAAAHTRVWDWLQTRPRGRCLVILDSIDDPALLSQASLVAAIMPTDAVHVLATTRCDSRAMGTAAFPVSLGSMYPPDALRLLALLRPFDASEKAAAVAIVNHLGGHALSLQLAGAFLRENVDVLYADFAEGLGTMGMLDVLEQARESVSGQIEYANIRQMQVEQLILPSLHACTEEERSALELAALMAPESVVAPWIQEALLRLFPESMRKKGLRDPWAAIVRKFTGLCLWQEQETNGLYRMHRLVREVLRANGVEANSPSQADSLCCLLHDIAMEAADAHINGRSLWPLRFFQELPATLEQWLLSEDMPESLLALPEILAGKILRGAGRDAQCASLVEQALRRISQMPSGSDKDTMTAAYLLCKGQALLSRGLAEEAITAYRTALELLGKDTGKNTPAVILQRIRCLDYAGEAELLRGRPVEALSLHRQSLALVEEILTGTHEGNIQWEMERCYTWDHLGTASEALGSDAGQTDALAWYRQSLERRTALCKENSDILRLQRDLGISFDFVGNAHGAAGHRDEASRCFSQALCIREELCKKDPDSVIFQRDLSVSYNRTGGVFAAENNWQQALLCFEKALAIRKKLVEREPENALLLYDYSLSQIKIGEIYIRMKQYGEALGYFHLALSIRKKLSADYPGSMKYVYGTALAWEKCASAHTGLKDMPATRQAFSEAARLVREPLAATPHNSPQRQRLEAALGELEALAQG